MKDYKGFRAVPYPVEPTKDEFYLKGIFNVMYVRENGDLACCGQAVNMGDFYAAVENILRRELPTWMTGKQECFWSEHKPNDRLRYR